MRWVSLSASRCGNRVGEAGGESFRLRWQQHRVPVGAEGLANPRGAHGGSERERAGAGELHGSMFVIGGLRSWHAERRSWEALR